MYSVAILVRHDTMGPFGEDASLIDAIVEENDGSYTIVPYKAKWFNELHVVKPRAEMHSPVDVAKQMGLVAIMDDASDMGMNLAAFHIPCTPRNPTMLLKTIKFLYS